MVIEVMSSSALHLGIAPHVFLNDLRHVGGGHQLAQETLDHRGRVEVERVTQIRLVIDHAADERHQRLIASRARAKDTFYPPIFEADAVNLAFTTSLFIG